MREDSRSSSKKSLTKVENSKDKKKSSPNRFAKALPKERHCGRIFVAVITRILFASHAGIALWRVSVYYSNIYIYFLSIGLFGLALEMIFTVIIRKGKEYKWFCPSVLFYLMSVVPCLWLLEISRFNGVMNQAISAGICNTSLQSHHESAAILGQIFDQTEQIGLSNNRSRRHTSSILEQQSIQFKALYSSKKYAKKLERLKRSNRKSRKTRQHIVVTTGLPPKQHQNESEATTSVNSHDLPSTFGESVDNFRTVSGFVKNISKFQKTTFNAFDLPVTTESTTLDQLTTTNIQVSDNNEEINLGNLGDKINKQISNLRQGTENIWSKTKEAISELDRTIDLSTWILLLHQVLLFVLVIGRWLLPKGDITRDQLSQLLLVFIGVGADILEFVTETIDGDEMDETNCVVILHFLIYSVWTWSLIQFTLVLTASKSRKTRVGFDNNIVVNTNANRCCGNSIFASADLWGILVTLFLQDVPFLATRLYILIVYNLKHQMMIFFTGKNALVVVLQIYRIIVLKVKRDRSQNNIDDAEIEPLQGTLRRLAKRATASNAQGDIKDASFKKQHDGSVVVKIHLEGEGSLKRKSKRSTRS